jgi:hypothetical protein
MPFTYQFSVGTMSVQVEGGGATNEIGIMTEISVSYDGDPQSFYAGDYRLPMAIELGNRSGEISASSSRFSTDDAPLTNEYVDVTLGLGVNSGGLAGTILGCKITNYNVSSTQNDFVTSDITLAIGDPNHIDKGGSYTWT